MSKKLTDMPALASLADGDLIHVVDVSDTSQDSAGSSKKVTIENLAAMVADLLNVAGLQVLATTSGDIDDSNLVFGMDEKPRLVNAGNVLMRENHGWNWNESTFEITLLVPVGEGNDIFGLK